MTQEAHTPIVVWEVTGWTNATPQRKEYAKETAHFYVRNDGRRDAKISRYYQFFATQEAAQAECDRRAAAKHDAAERERRIVACVNALAGIPIEAIESGVVAELVKAADAIERYLRETPHHNATQAAALRAALAKHGITLAEPKDWATELWADLFAVRGMPSAAKSTREGRLDDEDQAAIALIRERVVLKGEG